MDFRQYVSYVLQFLCYKTAQGNWFMKKATWLYNNTLAHKNVKCEKLLTY